MAHPCLNNGTCYDRRTSFECVCPEGYVGSLCEYSTVQCRQTPCQNGGTCAPFEDNSWVCFCRDGFSGPYCQNTAPKDKHVPRLKPIQETTDELTTSQWITILCVSVVTVAILLVAGCVLCIRRRALRVNSVKKQYVAAVTQPQPIISPPPVPQAPIVRPCKKRPTDERMGNGVGKKRIPPSGECSAALSKNLLSHDGDDEAHTSVSSRLLPEGAGSSTSKTVVNYDVELQPPSYEESCAGNGAVARVVRTGTSKSYLSAKRHSCYEYTPQQTAASSSRQLKGASMVYDGS